MDETRILSALLADEQAPWIEFVTRNQPVIRGTVRKTLRQFGARLCRDDVEDLIAEVWVALLRDGKKKLRAWRADGGLGLPGWVALLTRRLTIDQLRARTAHDTALGLFLAWQRTERAEAPPAEEQEEAILAERTRIVQAALRELPTPQRAFAYDCFHERLAPRALARAHGVAVGTIYSRKFKIREKLVSIVQKMEVAG